MCLRTQRSRTPPVAYHPALRAKRHRLGPAGQSRGPARTLRTVACDLVVEAPAVSSAPGTAPATSAPAAALAMSAPAPLASSRRWRSFFRVGLRFALVSVSVMTSPPRLGDHLWLRATLGSRCFATPEGRPCIDLGSGNRHAGRSNCEIGKAQLMAGGEFGPSFSARPPLAGPSPDEGSPVVHATAAER